MKLPQPVCIDFESFGIESRPEYPPKAVGVAIRYPGKKARYYAFNHPTENNCTRAVTTVALKAAWAYAKTCGALFHNAKFDVDVAETHFGVPPLPWDKVHDTMFLAFLEDPHAQELGLKPLGERFLGLPPEEQDAVGEWLVEHQPVEGVKISRSKNSDHYFGRYIAYAPGNLVGVYARGDVERTVGLFDLLWPRIQERGMCEAYDRERRLLPVLLEMERRGAPVDLKRLRADVKTYNEWRAKLNLWCLNRLGNPSPPKDDGVPFNLDSADQLVKAMVAAGVCDTSLMPKTATGKVSTAKDSLLLGVTDKVLLAVLKYRTQLNTCLNTFMEPWLRVAEKSQGLIFTQWHQVRGSDGGGTRTGRLSSTPNFQNIPLEFDSIFYHDDPKAKPRLPTAPFKGLPSLPKCRDYIKAFEKERLCGRDFKGQELRVTAHFEDDEMARSYIENPNLDLHQKMVGMITQTTGLTITRSDAKTINFSILYGSGTTKLALGLKCSYDQAKMLKAAYLNALPGVKRLINDLNMRAAQKLPIRTFGGREYYCEEPRIIDGRIRNFSYKLVNYLVQGSSADQTKDAVLRFHEKQTSGKLLLTVHDEILVSAPEKSWKQVMTVLRECMNDAGLDVPMLSDGETGKTWAGMEACE